MSGTEQAEDSGKDDFVICPQCGQIDTKANLHFGPICSCENVKYVSFQSLSLIITRTNVRVNAIVSGRASTASVDTLAKNGVGQELPHSARPAREKSARVLFSFQKNERFPRSPNESPEVPLSGGFPGSVLSKRQRLLKKMAHGS